MPVSVAARAGSTRAVTETERRRPATRAAGRSGAALQLVGQLAYLVGVVAADHHEAIAVAAPVRLGQPAQRRRLHRAVGLARSRRAERDRGAGGIKIGVLRQRLPVEGEDLRTLEVEAARGENREADRPAE